jgi:hypothetical protein
LFSFFERLAKPPGGDVPVGVNVNKVVFGHTLGVTKQAGRVNVVAYVIK